MEIKEIPREAWASLAPLFREHCDSDLPMQGTFYGVFDDDKLKACVLAENVTMIGQLFTVDNGDTAPILALITYLQKVYSEGNPVGLVASETRFGKFYEHLGLEKIDGTLYRRN